MQRITTFLWFDNQAEEAAKFYTSLFPNSKITDANPMSVAFVLDGVEYIALNGGPQYKFNEAISLFVKCQDQAEIDRLWNALTADGGEESRCGWLKDKYGLSWQIVPHNMGELLNGPDAINAMLTMNKLDIKTLQEAGKAAQTA